MVSWRKLLRPRNAVLLLLIILVIAFIITLFGDLIIEFFQSPDPAASMILVLDDSDPDFHNPPFEDRVVSFTPHGKTIPKLTGLNICETIGGARMLAASPDGEFFLIAENVSHRLIACRTQTGARLWTLDGEFDAAVVAPDGTTYAIISAGTIYGSRTVVIDRQGQIIKDVKVGGTDIALDTNANVLWLVGATIKKCALDLTVVRESHPLPWCTVSVDVNLDGSIWAAERQHPNIAQSGNRLLRVSASGMWIEKTVNLDFSPLCVRVDRSDDSFWVTGGTSRTPFTARLLASIEQTTGRLPTGKKLRDFLTRARGSTLTYKYDTEGNILFKINHGGHSLDIDPVDGSVWIAGRKKICHHSRTGKQISQFSGTFGNQKYVAVVPPRKP